MIHFNNCVVCVLMLLVRTRADTEQIERVEAVVGQRVELPCNVASEKKDDKLSVLAWYRNESRTAIYSRDLRHEKDNGGMSQSKRYRLIETGHQNRLQIQNVLEADSGIYFCRADFAASPVLKTYVQLDVIVPPEHLWVISENGTRIASASTRHNVSSHIGPYYIGDIVNLICVAFRGTPQPTLSWWVDESPLNMSVTTLSRYRVRSDLEYGPLRREDDGRVFTCSAVNSERALPVAVDLTLNMILPPELVSLRSTSEVTGLARVKAGEMLNLECRVLGARPTPKIIWKLNDGYLYNLEENVTNEASQRLTVSEAQLQMTRRLDEAHVTCCAKANLRDVDFVCADGLPLSVVYPPKLEVTTNSESSNNTVLVVKGTSVTLNCSYSANPSIYELIWYHEDEILTKERETTGILIEPVLTLEEVTERDEGEYVCAATNNEGSRTSEPIYINVTFPPYCTEEAPVVYGLSAWSSVNLSCAVSARPEAQAYRWLVVQGAVNASALRGDEHSTALDTDTNELQYQRPGDTPVTTIFCWGMNSVKSEDVALLNTPCTFIVTDKTAPLPPSQCAAVKNELRDITVTCRKGHDGGLPQTFLFTVTTSDPEKQLLSITNVEPQFIIREPTEDGYKFVILSMNEKGESDTVEIKADEIIDNSEGSESISAVADITTLSLSLCGGVALLALAACGLVLCARDSAQRQREPALHAYNTDESNCETCNESDEGSDYNLKRTDSFRRALTRYPSRSYDMNRTSSFHSARCINELEDRFPKIPKHSAHCRVRSMQNISRKREIDTLCDHLTAQLHPETASAAPRPLNTFYTIPRKIRHRSAKEPSDETSEVTQVSDGFSLPPPPDEFGSYRAGARLLPPGGPAYGTLGHPRGPLAVTSLAVGLPTAYDYPDDRQVTTNPFDDISD